MKRETELDISFLCFSLCGFFIVAAGPGLSVVRGFDLCTQNTKQYGGAFLHVPYLSLMGWKTARGCGISSVSQHLAACSHFTHQPLVSNMFHSSYLQRDVSVHCMQAVSDLSGSSKPQTHFSGFCLPPEVLATHVMLQLPEPHI